MELSFTKMHGAGNDYIYFDCFERTIDNPEELSIILSDRHFSIGGDGIVMILPSNVADARMRMFNADGSEAQMCGNAIRCVAKFIYENGYVNKDVVTIDTLGGIKTLKLHITDGRVDTCDVDMGQAILAPKDIPVAINKDLAVNEPIIIGGTEYRITCVSMGNPHAVVFVDDTEALDLPVIGPQFENHPLFPQRVNTEFIQIVTPNRVKMRVWERGSGETLACGTGACGAVVACVLNKHCPRGEEVAVELRGGTLYITWREDGGVTMRGPAAVAFRGTVEV